MTLFLQITCSPIFLHLNKFSMCNRKKRPRKKENPTNAGRRITNSHQVAPTAAAQLQIHLQRQCRDWRGLCGEMVNHIGINLNRVFVWHCPWGLTTSHQPPSTTSQWLSYKTRIEPLTSLSACNFTLAKKDLRAARKIIAASNENLLIGP